MLTTPGLWSHKWRPITFCLIVDDFVIEYIGKCNARHLRGVLKEHYTITEYWSGTKFAGIDLNWDYQQRTYRLSMKDYIRKLLLRHNHPTTTHHQLSPHCHVEINYGAKAQYTIEPAYSPPLDNASINHIQEIFGSLLLFACTVYYKILVTLSKIGTHQAAVTKQTNEAISKLLDYVVTYSNDGIIYRSSDMILAAHADGAYLNINRACSYAGAYIMLSENDPNPCQNSYVLIIAQIIKFVLSLAAKAELAVLFIYSKYILPLYQTLSERGWPQPKTHFQTYNSTTVGVINNNIMPRCTKSMNTRFYWLRCCKYQDKFCYYLAPGASNLAD